MKIINWIFDRVIIPIAAVCIVFIMGVGVAANAIYHNIKKDK